MTIYSCVAKIGCGIGLLLSLAAVHGAVISLDFNTMPSAQGWTYIQEGPSALESDAFTVASGVLQQNTIGIGGGASSPGTTAYRLFDIIDPLRPFSLSLRARILEEESFPPSTRPFGFVFAAYTGVEEFGVGFTTSSIQTIDGVFGGSASIPLDTTQFHDYLLNVTPGVGYSLFVDSVLARTGTPFDIVFPTALELGDGTGLANARAEVTRYVFSQVPEPTSIALTLVGLAAFWIVPLRAWRG